MRSKHGEDVLRISTMAGRILRFTSLSPTIVELILDGNEPKGLSLRKLLKGFSLDWEQPRKDWLNPNEA